VARDKDPAFLDGEYHDYAINARTTYLLQISTIGDTRTGTLADCCGFKKDADQLFRRLPKEIDTLRERAVHISARRTLGAKLGRYQKQSLVLPWVCASVSAVRVS
jgi:hypothetical protein